AIRARRSSPIFASTCMPQFEVATSRQRESSQKRYLHRSETRTPRHGPEARPVLLDHHLVEFAFALPSRLTFKRRVTTPVRYYQMPEPLSRGILIGSQVDSTSLPQTPRVSAFPQQRARNVSRFQPKGRAR